MSRERAPRSREFAVAGADVLPLTGLREREYSRLDRYGEAYLDYTGTALYAESQVERHCQRLREGIFGNPHSANGPSQHSTSTIESARRRVLTFLDAPDEYDVVFTANTSAAIKLVAEGYGFGKSSQLVLAADNHNSMNGIREFARSRGAPVSYIPLDSELRLDCPVEVLSAGACESSLFGFPAQSNFSGVRHPLSLVADAQALGYRVILDAAAFLPTSRLSLRSVPADFVVFSGYKILGFPTGVGALVAKRQCLGELVRPWFAGGTVDYASVQHRRHLLQRGPEGFEDGTPAFLDIVALDDGFDFLEEVGQGDLSDHVTGATAYALQRLQDLVHVDGSPMIELYGPASCEMRGGTLAFNLLRQDGTVVPFDHVVAQSRREKVSLRGGCFCNPGASEAAFGFPLEETRRCLDAAGDSTFSIERFSECLGASVRVGAVRMSFGIPTVHRDIDRAIDVLSSVAAAAHAPRNSRASSPLQGPDMNLRKPGQNFPEPAVI